MSPLSALLVLFVADACALHAAVAPAWTRARGPMVAHATHARPAMHFKLDAVAQQRMPTIRMSAPVEEPRRTAKVARVVARTMSTFAVSMLLPAIALAAGAPGEKLHLGEKVALFFQGFGLPDWAVLALISATPAIELRGGVPVGNWMGLSPALTFLICVVGNMAPIAPMLLALRSTFFKKLAAPLLKRAEKKLAGLPTGQSRTLALALFVGVPAPGTGAWTGAIIAYLLDMPFGTAMASILAGVVLAGGIMTTLTLAGKVGALVALAVLLAGGIGAIASAGKSEGGDEPPAEPTPA